MKVLEALNGFWIGMVAILATLRSHIAQSVAIGTNIGKRISEIAHYALSPALYLILNCICSDPFWNMIRKTIISHIIPNIRPSNKY